MGVKTKEKLDKLARIEAAQRKSSEDWRKRKKEGGQKQISIWLENSKIEALERICAHCGKNRSEIVSEMIDTYDATFLKKLTGDEKEKYMAGKSSE